MKRFLLMFVLVTKLFSQDVPVTIDEEISVWVESSYPVSVFGEETAKSMYEEEVANYKWIKTYALDLDVLKQVEVEFPPKEFGYKILKLMYETQIKQENM